MIRQASILLLFLALLPVSFADAQITINKVTISGLAEGSAFPLTNPDPGYVENDSQSFFSDTSTNGGSFFVDAFVGIDLFSGTPQAELYASVYDDGFDFAMAAVADSADGHHFEAMALFEVDFQLGSNSRLSSEIEINFAGGNGVSEISLLNTDTNMFYDLGTSGTEIIDAGNYLFRNQVHAIKTPTETTFSHSGSNYGNVTFTAVPEPSVLIMLTVVGAMSLFRREKIAS